MNQDWFDSLTFPPKTPIDQPTSICLTPCKTQATSVTHQFSRPGWTLSDCPPSNQDLEPEACRRSRPTQDQMAQLYLVNVRDELALPGHVDLLIVGPHLALNSKKQHFQVPLLSKPKYRGKEKKYIYVVPSRGEIHLLLEKKIFQTAIQF